MEFLERNKLINIQIFYYYVFFKDQSFWLILVEIELFSFLRLFCYCFRASCPFRVLQGL